MPEPDLPLYAYDPKVEELRQHAAAVPYLEGLRRALLDEPQDANHEQAKELIDKMIVDERGAAARALLEDPTLVKRVNVNRR